MSKWLYHVTVRLMLEKIREELIMQKSQSNLANVLIAPPLVYLTEFVQAVDFMLGNQSLTNFFPRMPQLRKLRGFQKLQ